MRLLSCPAGLAQLAASSNSQRLRSATAVNGSCKGMLQRGGQQWLPEVGLTDEQAKGMKWSGQEQCGGKAAGTDHRSGCLATEQARKEVSQRRCLGPAATQHRCSKRAHGPAACPFGSGAGLVLPGSKDGAAHPHVCGPHLHRRLEVAAHAHAQLQLALGHAQRRSHLASAVGQAAEVLGAGRVV